MNLLFYINTLKQGGAERVIVNLANKFAENGHDVTFTVMFDSHYEYNYQLNDNVRYVDLNVRLPSKKFTLKYFLGIKKRVSALRNLLKKERPTLILSFLPTSVFTAYVANVGIGIKSIVSQRNAPVVEYSSAIIRLVFRHIFSKSDGCVFQNKEQAKFFSPKINAHSKVIPNLVDERFFNIEPPEERKNIIGVGRHHKQKRWDIAIRAFASISIEADESFYIYGADNGERHNLQVMIDELGLSDRVFLKEAVSNIQNYLNEAKLFVMSSDFEGMPNALLEAQVLGVPCVSTKFHGGAAEEIIADGENGLIVRKEDVDALAAAMKKVLSDEKFAEQLGKNAKESAKRYHPEAIFKQWEGYFAAVLAKDFNRKI